MYEYIFVYVGIDYIYFSLFGVIIVHSAFIWLCHLLNWILKVYIKVKRASLVVKNGYVVKTLPANAGPLVQSLVQESKRNEQIRIFF